MGDMFCRGACVRRASFARCAVGRQREGDARAPGRLRGGAETPRPLEPAAGNANEGSFS